MTVNWTRFSNPNSDPTILRLVRVEKPGSELDLFLVERQGTYYVLSHQRGGNLSFGVVARSESRAAADAAFDRALHAEKVGVELYSGSGRIVATEPDARAEQHLQIFSHPMWGVDWSGGAEPEPEEADFRRILAKQVQDWKGSSNSLAVTGHRYWPEFHRAVVGAVRKKYGPEFTLYRGIYGKQAEAVLGGAPVALHPYSSWTVKKSATRVYRGRGDTWVTLSARFLPRDVALAPVDVPGWPELLRFATDVQHGRVDEVVIGPLTELRDFRIVAHGRGRTWSGRMV